MGLGLIGGSLAKAFREYTDCTVCGFDRDPAVVQAALDCGAIDRAGGEEDFSRLDLLFLAVYPQAAVDFARGARRADRPLLPGDGHVRRGKRPSVRR